MIKWKTGCVPGPTDKECRAGANKIYLGKRVLHEWVPTPCPSVLPVNASRAHLRATRSCMSPHQVGGFAADHLLRKLRRLIP